MAQALVILAREVRAVGQQVALGHPDQAARGDDGVGPADLLQVGPVEDGLVLGPVLLGRLVRLREQARGRLEGLRVPEVHRQVVVLVVLDEALALVLEVVVDGLRDAGGGQDRAVVIAEVRFQPDDRGELPFLLELLRLARLGVRREVVDLPRHRQRAVVGAGDRAGAQFQFAFDEDSGVEPVSSDWMWQCGVEKLCIPAGL
jgi:hypothetical protein